MAYKTPTFNLLCNVWQNYTTGYPIPAGTPPTIANLPCQLRSTITGLLAAAASGQFGLILILVPQGTDVRGPHFGASGDTIECPAGSKRYYIVQWVDDRAKGFANEYRVAAVRQNTTPTGGWPYPTP